MRTRVHRSRSDPWMDPGRPSDARTAFCKVMGSSAFHVPREGFEPSRLIGPLFKSGGYAIRLPGHGFSTVVTPSVFVCSISTTEMLKILIVKDDASSLR